MYAPTPVVRPAAVAGAFYPAEPRQLAAEVAALLAAAAQPQPRLGWPKALVVPHAGYVYSGAVAASAFAEWARGRHLIRRVILLGPAHHVPVQGMALPDVTAFATPLGEVPLDMDALLDLTDLPWVSQSLRAHAWEHALEVQLPFLQTVLDQFTLVPIVVGAASPAQVAEVIERLWGGPETVIALSTDLSHFHPQADAEVIDARTAARILSLHSDIRSSEACGAAPLNGLLLAAQHRALTTRRVAQCTSADTAGEPTRVVGYGAFALEDPDLADDRAGPQLIALARQAIAHRLGLAPQPHPAAWWLQANGATFVTLTCEGALRGCIGTLEARWPLGRDLLANAVHAAFDDPRFAPVAAAQWPDIHVEVSVLSAPQPLQFSDEADLLAQLRPHEDGLILESAGQRGTFLPQVWQELPDKRQFLAHLRAKAGLAPNTPLTRCKLWRYRVAKFTELGGAS